MSIEEFGTTGRLPSRLMTELSIGAFALALFVSAVLLFSLQPMFTKMVLPRLGGSPAVWSVAMVFFQAMLLMGYSYAHVLTRFLPLPLAFVTHAVVLLIGWFLLPLAVAHGFDRPPVDGAVPWLIALFAQSVGLPFFAISANGPLLQAWFARSGHVAARDPYFLYGASNLGSFMALLLYPLGIEPWLALSDQTRVWTVAYAMLAGAIGVCGLIALSTGRGQTSWSGSPSGLSGLAARNRPSWRLRSTWIGLAFVPSALLVAVTAHISTDVASAPLLWVVPLALYLLTFVIAFRDRAIVSQDRLLSLQPSIAACLAVSFVFSWRTDLIVSLVLHLGSFVVFVLVCHAALYRLRPLPERLTEFYMCMSLGGVIGGIFAALIAPHLFVTVAEYPLLLLAALLVRPDLHALNARRVVSEVWPVALVATIALAPALLWHAGVPLDSARYCGLAVVLLSALAILQQRRPARFIALTALAFAITQIYDPGTLRPIFARSFFGVHKVVDMADGRFRVLFHGTTVHGAERILNDDDSPVEGAPEPLTYYYRGGPFSQAIAAARSRDGGILHRVAVIGLGVGALACHAMAHEAWHFFEIDPEVVRLATNPQLFRSLSTCLTSPRIVLGDARLTIADESAGFDLIVVDAFTSDVVPTHLLTREALALFKSKLSPHGSIAFNISNRNIELASVIAGSAEANDMVTLVKRDTGRFDPGKTFLAPAEIAVVARQSEDTGLAAGSDQWRTSEPASSFRIWTDDYSDIVGAIVRKYAD
jgi:hypothetical protein